VGSQCQPSQLCEVAHSDYRDAGAVV